MITQCYMSHSLHDISHSTPMVLSPRTQQASSQHVRKTRRSQDPHDGLINSPLVLATSPHKKETHLSNDPFHTIEQIDNNLYTFRQQFENN